MLLKDFEDTLKNIENDRMLMSYGDNSTVVNNILSIVNMTQSLSNVIKGDRISDMFSFNVSNKIMELENIVVMYGYQRLTERGINAQAGFQQQFSPMQPNMMMGQPMQFGQMPNMMMGQQPMYAPQMYPQMPQMQPQYQQQPMPQQPMPQPAPAPAPQPAAAPAPAPAPQPAPQAAEPKPVVNTAPQPKKESSGSSPIGGLPGMGGGGDEKAVGRDFLLKLLEEKG